LKSHVVLFLFFSYSGDIWSYAHCYAL